LNPLPESIEFVGEDEIGRCPDTKKWEEEPKPVGHADKKGNLEGALVVVPLVEEEGEEVDAGSVKFHVELDETDATEQSRRDSGDRVSHGV